MKQERWEKIERLYHAASQKSDDTRGAFLEEACSGDPKLRREVELLLEQDDRAETFLELPALEVAAQDLASEEPDWKGKRIRSYQVLSFLGRGGMGEVYLARDEKLGRKVAFKFLTEKMRLDRVARQRFLREAKSAAALDHPFICKIYEIGEIEGTAFIVMEYVQGETLAEVLTRGGALPSKAALELMVEVAEALEFAHQHLIVHRDLKPSNMILTREGHIKVMDFGLAKRLAGTESVDTHDANQSEMLSRSGMILGTPAYMSPEQLLGQLTDTRSDIFSLGVVLYEALTGKHPFLQATPVDTTKAILSDDPDLDCLPPDPILRYVVGKMLAKAPDSRYQLVREARRDMQELTRSRPERPATGASQTNYPLWLMILLSTAVLSGWVFLSPFFVSPGVPLAEGAAILVTDLDNQTKDGGLDAVSEMLRNQLQQSAYFEVAEPARIRDVLDRMVRPSEQRLDLETAREVAWREGIPLILRSSLSRLGSNYLLAIDLEEIAEDPRFRERGWGRTFTAESKDGIFDAVDSASRWIRQTVGETAQDLSLRDVPVREATTSSWRALELYSKAEALTQQDRHGDAILLLEDAVRIDPDFALATMRMGDILISLGRYGEGYQFWRKAQETTERRRLTKREEYRIRAMYALDTGDFATAESRFKIFSIHYPNDYYPFFFHAFALRALGREEEAIQKFREAQQKWPTLYYIPVQLAKTYLLTGDFQAARGEATDLRRLEQDEWADFVEGATAFLERDDLKAYEHFESLLASPDPYWRSSAASFLANILGERGAYRNAIELLLQNVENDREHPDMFARRADKLLGLGYIWYRLGNLDRCKEFCLEAIEADASPQRLQRAGALLARSGFIREAEDLLTHLDAYPDVPVAVVARSRIMGEVLLARGSYREALALLQEADALEPSYAQRDYLARALVQLEDYEGALKIYEEINDFPGKFWLYPNEEFPGFWADTVFDHTLLALSAGAYCEALDSVRRYLSIRQLADEEITDVKQARAILENLEKQEPCNTVG